MIQFYYACVIVNTVEIADRKNIQYNYMDVKSKLLNIILLLINFNSVIFTCL